MRTGRPKAPLILNREERRELESLAHRSRSVPALARRARIVLACAEGQDNKGVAHRLRATPATVGKWRTRFVRERLAGLYDEPRPGAPRSITDDEIEQVVVRTLESTPRGATHWSTRGMAKAIGLSHATISRIWHAFGLQPHRSETFKLSPDPLLVTKVRDIVGLYVNPPEHAVVLCVDEKSQIQALDRAAAADAARQARAADARLQAPWHHLAVCRARRQERQSDRPDASPPSVHRVPQVPGPHRRQRARRSRCPPHPGQLRNAQNTAHPGVVRQASPVSRALHTHLWLVAEPRGALVPGTDDDADPA